MRLVHFKLPQVRALMFGVIALLVGACSTLDRSQPPSLEKQATWAVLPFSNNTETPLAANRAEAISESLLRTRTAKVKRYPAQQEALFETSERKQLDEAMDWARKQGARYALTGAVDEWRYKVGVDGEPAVGVALQIIDLQTGESIWSGTGGKSGWSREALSAVAQQLIRDLLSSGLSGL